MRVTMPSYRRPAAARPLHFLQQNVMRGRVATDELRAYYGSARQYGRGRADVLLLQEPYAEWRDDSHWALVHFDARERVFFRDLGEGNWPLSAVVVLDASIDAILLPEISTRYVTCVELVHELEVLYVVSWYRKPSDLTPMELLLPEVERALDSLRGRQVVIAADVNAHSPLWYRPGDGIVSDAKAAMIEAFVAARDLHVANVPGRAYTFHQHSGIGSGTNNDVTLVTRGIAGRVEEWKVATTRTTSDHRILRFWLRPRSARGRPPRERPTSRFNVRKADWPGYVGRYRSLREARSDGDAGDGQGVCSPGGIDRLAEILGSDLVLAAESTVPRRRLFPRSKPWWRPALNRLRAAKDVARRRFQREKKGRPPGVGPSAAERALYSEYSAARRLYTRTVRSCKRQDWREFVTEKGNSDPYGLVYRMARGKVGVDRALSAIGGPAEGGTYWGETASRLLDALVPTDPDPGPLLACLDGVHGPWPFTRRWSVAEAMAAIRKMANGRAPGLDLVEPEMIKAVSRQGLAGDVTSLANSCLDVGYFPASWKTSDVRVLLKSNDRDAADLGSYRPICLLPMLSKVLERLIRARLDPFLRDPLFASPDQYGFVAGRGTEDAHWTLREVVDAASPGEYVLSLMYDFKAAFDNLRHADVVSALWERGCPPDLLLLVASYLSDRRVSMRGNQASVTRDANMGCPQGSILGPDFWNLVLDGLLLRLRREGFTVIAYADDLAVVVTGTSRHRVELLAQAATDIIADWCDGKRLRLSAGKTVMVLLKGSRGRGKGRADWRATYDFGGRPPVVKIGGNSISYVQTAKYLGVYVGAGMRMVAHVNAVASKVTRLVSALAGYAGRNWGLSCDTWRTLHDGVLVPVALYAASAWADRLSDDQYAVLSAAQRGALARMAKSYASASAMALTVVTGTPPIRLLAREARIRYLVKRGFSTGGPRDEPLAALAGGLEGLDMAEARRRLRAAVEEAWNGEYLASRQAAATKRFFPTVSDRLHARWVRLDHYVTQFLTGHGDFGSKLRGLGLRSIGDCWCGAADTDTHTLFECPIFEGERRALRESATGSGLEWPPPWHRLVGRDLFSEFRSASGGILRAKEDYGRAHPRDVGRGVSATAGSAPGLDRAGATGTDGGESC